MSFNRHFSTTFSSSPLKFAFYCLNNLNAVYYSHLCVWAVFTIGNINFLSPFSNFVQFRGFFLMLGQFWQFFFSCGIAVHIGNINFLSPFSDFVQFRGFFLMLGQFWQFFFHVELLILSFGAFFKAFITTFPLGEYVTFCHSLTFGVTFWYLEIFFSWNGWIKVD